MAGKDNLKPVRSKTEARERGKKGGIASGESRRKRKALKEELLALLEDGDTQEKVCLALLSQARRGNIKAFEVLRDTIGEKPVEKRPEPDDSEVVIFVDSEDEMRQYLEGRGGNDGD